MLPILGDMDLAGSGPANEHNIAGGSMKSQSWSCPALICSG
ncbi:hypothetical protein ACMS1Z_13355 [Acidiphilium multivorum]